MKRLLDLAIVVPSLVVLSPLLLAISVCVKLTSPGPVLFRQRRVGWQGQLFEIRKFRTMIVDRDQNGPQVTAATDPRITPFGRFLRQTKLDELPQLVNVLRGTMSLVGPRPQVPRFVAHYPAHIRDVVFSVRPGITDPAAIAYRHEEELLAHCGDPERTYIDRILPLKLALYVQYVRRQSLVTDLRILAQTIDCLLRPRRRVSRPLVAPATRPATATPNPALQVSEGVIV